MEKSAVRKITDAHFLTGIQVALNGDVRSLVGSGAVKAAVEGLKTPGASRDFAGGALAMLAAVAHEGEAGKVYVEINEQCEGVHCVDLGESFPTSTQLQNLASGRD